MLVLGVITMGLLELLKGWRCAIYAFYPCCLIDSHQLFTGRFQVPLPRTSL